MSSASPCIDDCTSIVNISSIGFGDDFARLMIMYENFIQDFKESETIGRPQKNALTSLEEIIVECSAEGWDGYDAAPVSDDAYDEAKRLLESLPLATFPMPEIVPEPDGGIGLEWYKGKRQVFVVSLRRMNEIVYAGLYGLSRTYGTEYFGTSLPRVIIDNLKRLFSD